MIDKQAVIADLEEVRARLVELLPELRGDDKRMANRTIVNLDEMLSESDWVITEGGEGENDA